MIPNQLLVNTALMLCLDVSGQITIERPFYILFSVDMDADITQLEAPTFSTINKGPPEPMLRLNWDHKTHLIGEKVINPMIHCCDKCEAPILIYGRMVSF